MRLFEIQDSNILKKLDGGRRLIVVYGGGFQPFHVGHMSSYLEGKAAFPSANFYVAASNVTSERPIPFTEKRFLAQQAGVNDPFIQVGTMSYVNDKGRKVTSTPLNPLEILQKYDPERDVLIILRSERDPMKTTATSYYQPWKGMKFAEPFSKHAYIYVTKKHDFHLCGKDVCSGTQVRNMYQAADDTERKKLIKQLYPKAIDVSKVKKILDNRLGTV
jgi:hypothetical protein